MLGFRPLASGALASGAAGGLGFPATGATFVLTGMETVGRLFYPSEPAAFVLTGMDVQPFLGVIELHQPAAFNVSGQQVLLQQVYQHEFAAFLLSGQTTNVGLVSSVGQFLLTLNDILPLLLHADVGQFDILGWSVTDIPGPTGDHIFLVELQAHDGSTLLSFYLSTEGFTSLPIDTPANQFYMPRVIDPGNFERHLFAPGTTRGRASIGSGDVIVANGDPGNGETLDAWLDYGFDEREIVIKSLPYGERSVAAATILFQGRMQKLVSTRPLDQLEIEIHDRLAELEKPLLSTRYAGTTLASGPTAEGNQDLAGKLKQRVFGSAFNVPLQPANPYDLIYLANNGATASILVYDGGLPLTNAGDNPSIASLQSAVIATGSYRTCLALGLVRLGATPAFAVTADVVQAASAANRTAAQIARNMLLDFGVDPLDLAPGTFTSLDTKNDAEVQYFVDDDRDALAAIQDVLDSIGGWILPRRDAAFEVGRFEAPSASPAFRFDVDTQVIADTLERVDDELPSWRIILEYAPNWTVQGEDQLAGGATAATRTFVGNQFRTITVENSAVLTKHLAAPEKTIRTYLREEADAEAEAARLMALYGDERERYRVTLMLSDAWSAEPGISIMLTHPRLGMENGTPFNVLGRVDEYEKETVTLDLWG